MKPALRLLSVLLLVLVSGAGAAVDEPLIGQATVIDGDTLEVAGKRIRLYGVDAPESRQSCGQPPWPCGRRTAFAFADFIGKRPVSCDPVDRDRYGRIVASCRVGDDDLGAWLVRQGWAMASRQYSGRYVAFEDEARIAGRGIWSGHFTPPWEWRRR